MTRRKLTDLSPRWTVEVKVRMSPDDLARVQAARLPRESLGACVRRLALDSAPSPEVSNE